MVCDGRLIMFVDGWTRLLFFFLMSIPILSVRLMIMVSLDGLSQHAY